MGRDYFVSTNGDDSSDGLSMASSWKTVERANAHHFEDGDRLLFEGGQTFPGTLLITGVQAPKRGFIITSFGDGRATIHGGSGSGIVLRACSGVHIQGLATEGLGRKTGNEHGTGIQIDHCHHVTIDDAEAFGFQFAGLAVEGSSHVTITRVLARDNGFAGITTRGDRNHDLYIGYSRAINNPGDPSITDGHSGSGICLYAVSDALVEFCEAAENGWDMQQVNRNGPVGIWTAVGADRVTIQYCIAHHNKSTKGDGGGFDFDGGTTNCLMQYNYSYENGGCGYLLCQYPGGALWKNNTVRYCISENDGQTDHKASFFTFMGEILYDSYVYNNIVYNSSGRNCVHGAPIGSHWYNNVFLLDGDGEFLHQVDPGTGSFQGNCYWRLDGSRVIGGYPSFDDWRAATGYETRDGQAVGMQVDPGIALPGDGDTRLTNPSGLRSLPWYRLSPDSPLFKAGLNLTTLFGIDPGQRDFFGRLLPSDENLSIGVSESF